MNYTITDDQNYCSFGDGIVYEFCSSENSRYSITCSNCFFSVERKDSSTAMKCKLVPCQPAKRKDNKDGFWKQSIDVDFETFTSMFT